MTLEEFIQAFAQLKQAGYVRTQRRGPTGVGHTMEQLLGLTENNVALPDLGDVELKAHRIGSPSMITLFTFNKKAWRMNPLQAVKTFGTPDENGRLGLYFTMSFTPNRSGLFLEVGANAVTVKHTSGLVIVEWQLKDLERQFAKKLPALLLVSARSKVSDGVEWFHYTKAQLLTEPSTIGGTLEVLTTSRIRKRGESNEREETPRVLQRM